MPVVLTRSTIDSIRNCSTSMPPSWLICVLRWNPVAIFWSTLASRPQVAGDLVDRELIERHVAVERGDDPVAVLPDRPGGVDVEAVRVGVAGLVEPEPPPPLAVMGRGQQAIDQALVGVGPGVGQEGVDLLGAGRQAGQVERNAPQQRRAIGLGGGLEPSPARAAARMNRSIGLRTQPDERDLGDGRPTRGHERPVRTAAPAPGLSVRGRLGPLVDPGPEQVDLVATQRRPIQRHPLARTLAEHGQR